MAEIIRITIKGASGYGPVYEAFSDKVTIDRVSIRYDYKPVIENETNMPRKWTYKTSSLIFQELFLKIATEVVNIINWEEEMFATDVGATIFTVTYADKTKASRKFFLPRDEFRECFSIIKQMVPRCELTPVVLLTSEDFTDGDEV